MHTTGRPSRTSQEQGPASRPHKAGEYQQERREGGTDAAGMERKAHKSELTSDSTLTHDTQENVVPSSCSKGGAQSGKTLAQQGTHAYYMLNRA